MRLKELIKNLDYWHCEHVTDCQITDISPDSNYIHPGSLFVAIKGQRFDGHNFINSALEKGAAAVILEKDLSLKKNVGKVVVQDSRIALACVSASFFGHPSRALKVIGVTGTNGKTTISYLIESILVSAGYASGVVGTVNYRVGKKIYPAINTTPQADFLQSFLQEIVLTQSKYAIIEVSSHALAQHRVDYVDFSTAIFTNLTPEHLDYHKTLTKYFSCKASLFERLPAHSWAVVNVDDEWGRQLAKRIKLQILTYGIGSGAQIQAKNLRFEIDKLKLTAVTPQGNIEIESSLVGRHNVYNILAAVSTGVIEKIDPTHIASGIKACRSICGRLERIDCGQNFLVFVDYAHTEDALRKILLTSRQFTKNKIILVFGCGGNRDRAKRPKMGKVACEIADFVILTNDNPRKEDPNQIISDIKNGIDKKSANYKVVLDRFQAIQEALFHANKNDIVIIAGKGHESTQIFADKAIPFSDQQTIKQILQQHLTN